MVDNTNDVARDYKGVSMQADYRGFSRVRLSGNWMISSAGGSVEGEDLTNGATRASANEYPEYRQASWNYPVGHTNGDQLHKVRLWGTYDLPIGADLGAFVLGFMQRYDSGLGYDYNITVDPRPYVTNPGNVYITPPSSVTYYLSERGGLRFNGIWRTDLSLSWNRDLKGLGGAQVFFRGIVNNVLNTHRVESFNTTILSRSTDTTLAAFDPFRRSR